MNYWVAQLIGFAGLTFSILSFQQKQRQGILFFQILAALAYFFHFLLLGALTGSVMNLFGAARNVVFYYQEKAWAGKKFWVYLFILIYIVSTIFTWKNGYSIFPLVGMIVGTVGFRMKNPKYTRLIMLVSPPCWFTYNLVSGSIPGMLTEVFNIGSIVVGIIRFDLKKTPKD